MPSHYYAHTDEEGSTYFEHKETGEVIWELPADDGDDNDDDDDDDDVVAPPQAPPSKTNNSSSSKAPTLTLRSQPLPTTVKTTTSSYDDDDDFDDDKSSKGISMGNLFTKKKGGDAKSNDKVPLASKAVAKSDKKGEKKGGKKPVRQRRASLEYKSNEKLPSLRIRQYR